MTDDSLIIANNISYKINENKLFHNLSFDIKGGSALHIKGKNGSGKSTLLRIILGITDPTKGSIYSAASLQICYLGHKNALKNYLTMRDNIHLMQLNNHMTRFTTMRISNDLYFISLSNPIINSYLTWADQNF